MIEAWILHLKDYPGTTYAKHLRKHTRVMIWYRFVLLNFSIKIHAFNFCAVYSLTLWAFNLCS